MTRASDLALMSLVVGMFLTLLVCMGVVGFYAYKINNADYRYDLLKQDYTQLIYQMERSNESKLNRLQEQMNNQQFTQQRRLDLLEDQLRMERNKTKPIEKARS